MEDPNVLIMDEVHDYLKKRKHLDKSEVESVIVFDKNKNWQIVQNRHSDDIYLIILKQK